MDSNDSLNTVSLARSWRRTPWIAGSSPAMTGSERLRARIGRAAAEQPLKLRFDRRLVDHRPDLRDSLVPEWIEHVLGKNDPPAVHRQPEKETLRPAVEAESTRDVGRIADQKFDVELEVRDLLEIALEH